MGRADAIAHPPSLGLALFHRLRGTLLLRLPEPDADGAEVSFRRALEVARSQSARPLLAEIYGWFTEGLATRDLEEARVMLSGLGAAERSTRPRGEAP